MGLRRRLMANNGGAFVPAPALSFDFRESTLTPQIGSATLAVTRAGNTATRINASGLIETINANLPRFDFNPATLAIRGLLVEEGRTNLCQRSEDFSTVWANVGTPTLSAGSTTAGILSLSLLGDDSGAALEGKTQTVTFTGDAVKAVSVFVKKGTATSSVVRLRDTTAGADRLLAAVTWSGAVPVVTMTTGTDMTGTPEQLGSTGIYRLLFATTSVTAANTNSLQVYPATDAALATAATGNIEIGGVQAEDGVMPTSYIQTPGSATVARAADSPKIATLGSWFNAVVGTLWVEATPRIAVQASNFPVAISLDDDTTNERIFLANNSSANHRFTVTDGGVSQADNNAGGSIVAGTFSKWAISYKANDILTSANGGATVADTSATLPTVSQLCIGVHASSINPYNGWIRQARYYAQCMNTVSIREATR